jgi:hypothetical protein
MKIIKYSADNLSSGSLCGLDVDESLQVTHCFPVVDEAEGKPESHQLSMLRSLREVPHLALPYARALRAAPAPATPRAAVYPLNASPC